MPILDNYIYKSAFNSVLIPHHSRYERYMNPIGTLYEPYTNAIRTLLLIAFIKDN